MIFLQCLVMGATIPIMSLYLKDYLGFSGSQAGIVLSMSAVAAFISPVVGAFVADRIIRAEFLLSLCHFCGCGVMMALSKQTSFGAVVGLYLAYVMVVGPTVALTNSITFHHFSEKKHNFGGIRVWGTIGWIAVAWGFGYLWLYPGGASSFTSRLPDALKLSAILSAVLGFYALTLPRYKFRPESSTGIIPLAALRVLWRPEILFISLIGFLVAFVDKYYYFGVAPFLRQGGFSEANIMPIMSLGQMSEVLAMSFLGVLLSRFGFKRIFILGLLSELWRFTALAMGSSTLLIMSGIFCHGFAYAFFFTSLYIYLDSHCNKNVRTGVHQLFAVITGGFGSFFGNLIAGRTADFFTASENVVNYKAFWVVPAVMSLICLAGVAVLFRDKEKPPAVEE